VKVLRNRQFQYMVAPTNTSGLAEFLFQAGAIKKQPASWRDYFFDHPALASGS
jgi:NitT/TauT family transport system substrate-binding protein